MAQLESAAHSFSRRPAPDASVGNREHERSDRHFVEVVEDRVRACPDLFWCLVPPRTPEPVSLGVARLPADPRRSSRRLTASFAIVGFSEDAMYVALLEQFSQDSGERLRRKSDASVIPLSAVAR
jgi:hypothetical protein